ncbi:MAG: DUF2723 domain-containing protein [Bacteroidota bacterium]|jgi:hypothetical protein
MKHYKLINIVLGWATFIAALYTYASTLEPTVSFWDCGEFISAAYRLQICHPPGAPLFLIIGRIFSLMAGNDVSQVAYWVNMVSGFTSALTVLFMFWTITHLAKKIVAADDNDLTPAKTIAIMGSGLVGALTLTFSDTFWFSAVEAEVYASSSFFTTLTFWCILKWENVAHEKGADRWLILIAYLIGLAIGVHLLNLLVIPAIVYVYYFKKYAFTRNGFLKASAVAIATIGIVQFGIIPGMPTMMTKFDYLFTNVVGLGVSKGLYIMLLSLVAFIYGILSYTHSQAKSSLYIALGALVFMGATSFVINASFSGFVMWAAIGGLFYWAVMKKGVAMAIVNTIVLCYAFVLIGYSSYSMVLIRSAANPPIDMNDPENPFSLLSYLNREQYGDNPLVYGQYFYAKVVDIKKGPMQYRLEGDKYVEAGAKLDRVFDPKDQTIFPRMWSERADHVQAYRQWEKIPEGKKATMGKNIDFLLSYQLGFMYWRYFFWNFVGRQNDEQGFGDVTRGNWLSGIKLIDNMRLGPQDNIPEVLMQNKARNVYFGLPLLLGIIGLIWHFRKSKEDATVVLTLFLFTGFFIILYLNFPAHQPRERDYAYVGSYQTFMIWIGLGVAALFDWLSKKLNPTLASGTVAIAGIAAVPLLMGQQNWDDHDRSQRYTALDFANNYLESCPPNSILFTNGDNDTYPLWYAQNVAGIRTDIRIINLSLLNTDWYTNNLKRKVYDSDVVPFSMTPDKYVQGKRDYVMFYNNPQVAQRYGINQTDYYPLKNIIAFINDDNDPLAKLQSQSGEFYNYFPTKKFYMLVNKDQVKKAGLVRPEDEPFIVDTMRWEVSNSTLMKADLVTLDIVASTDWTRPVCFAITTGSDVYLNMQKYFQINGLVYQIMPIENDQLNEGSMGRINTETLYDNLMNKFKWGNMDKPGIYLDETTLRQTNNYRNLFYRLAIRLIENGDSTRAIKVLDRCLEVMPEENVPYNQLMLAIAQAYYAAGGAEKGNMLVKRVSEIMNEKYRYYSRFKGNKKFASVSQDVEESSQIYNYAIQVAEQNKQPELAAELRKGYESMLSGK